MQQTQDTIMGMPITVDIIDKDCQQHDLDTVFDYFRTVDSRFSTYKDSSEISRINRGEVTVEDYSPEMNRIFNLAVKTKSESDSYFDIGPIGTSDPSGVVKGWSIEEAVQLLKARGFQHFYINAGGDIYAQGRNKSGNPWRVGIRNPFQPNEYVKIVQIENFGVATSGTYERGSHIYNPKNDQPVTEIVSLTVIGPSICDADRYATAAFAMGKSGISFIENSEGYEGYMIDNEGNATLTSQFNTHCLLP